MTGTSNFHDILAAELQKSGLGVNHAKYQTTFTKVLEFGNIQAASVIKIVGETTWCYILSKSKFADPGYIFKRVLGFGYLFTEYIIAGINLDAKEKTEINELGSLANLIISIYDHFIDNDLIEELPILPLIESMNRKEDLSTKSPLTYPESIEMQFFERLIKNYLTRLDAVNNHDRDKKIWQTLIKAIISMYKANRTLGLNPGINNVYYLLLRKSALSLIVMGLPGWLVSNEINGSIYFRHLRWMYKLGEFLAWIDDASDLKEDKENFKPNLIFTELEYIRRGNNSFYNIAKKIAKKGQIVDNDWKLMMFKKNGYCRDDINLLPVCVISWLGEYYS